MIIINKETLFASIIVFLILFLFTMNAEGQYWERYLENKQNNLMNS